MAKELKLDIKSPCRENWDEFESIGANQGYCQKCEKAVVDFSRMTDQQLLQYLQNAQGKVCGRMRKDQLKQYPMLENKTTFGFKHLRKSMIALALLLLSKPSLSTSQSLVKAETYIQEKDTESKQVIEKDGITVSGKVVDKNTGEELPGANVILKGSNIGVTTDIYGEFTFPKKLKKGDVLEIMFIGFERKEFKIKEDNKKFLTIELEMDLHQLGEVSIDHVYTGKQNRVGMWQKMVSWF